MKRNSLRPLSRPTVNSRRHFIACFPALGTVHEGLDMQAHDFLPAIEIPLSVAQADTESNAR